MTEQFTTIPAYPNYEVSELGNIGVKGSIISKIANGHLYGYVEEV